MKGLALIIGPKLKGKGALPASSSDDDDDAPDSEESEGSEDKYGEMLAEMAGVSEDDRSDFTEALRGFVKSCMRKAEKGDY